MKAFITALFLMCAAVLNSYADDLRLADNAPSNYTVVKGDTLWGISAKFLKDPWKWPQIWGMNREEIKNPHWIYPGNIIVLTMVDGQPHLTLQQGNSTNLITVKLSPAVRSETLANGGILPISASDIHAFTTQPVVLDSDNLSQSPMIVDYENEHIIVGTGDEIYATSDGSNTVNWQIVRPAKPIVDPDPPKKILGYSADYLGEARTVTPGNPQRIMIVSTEQEVQSKDRLMPLNNAVVFNYIPHAPDQVIHGKVISTIGVMREAGQYNNIIINKGARDGLEQGDVLAIYRKAHKVGDDLPKTQDKGQLPTLTLPETRVALCMVYRVFGQVSYALIMNSTSPVSAMDTVRNP